MRTHGNKSACAYAFFFDSRMYLSRPHSITHSYLVSLTYHHLLFSATPPGDKQKTTHIPGWHRFLWFSDQVKE
jgi:hypothetical protein